MKLVKQASGKTTIKMSKKEWETMGKKAGWLDKKAGGIREAESEYAFSDQPLDDWTGMFQSRLNDLNYLVEKGIERENLSEIYSKLTGMIGLLKRMNPDYFVTSA